MIGHHLIRHWSKRQSVIVLSSAEAELYGICKGAAEAMGLISTMGDFGNAGVIWLGTDSSAAIGVCHRQGLGKLRHLAVQDLWIQQAVMDGKVKLDKVPGVENPADVLTKPTTHKAMEWHLSTLGVVFEQGRAESAPKLL